MGIYHMLGHIVALQHFSIAGCYVDRTHMVWHLKMRD